MTASFDLSPGEAELGMVGKMKGIFKGKYSTLLALRLTVMSRTYIVRVRKPLQFEAIQISESIGLWPSEGLVHLDEANEVLHGQSVFDSSLL